MALNDPDPFHPVNQPDQSWFARRTEQPRLAREVSQGATVQAGDPDPIHPINQPNFAYYRYSPNRLVDNRTTQILIGPTNQQTYVFPVNQPEMRYLTLQRIRYIVDASRSLTGATIQQTYVFFPNQPELIAYAGLQRNRFETMPYTPLELGPPLVPQQQLSGRVFKAGTAAQSRIFYAG